MSQLLQRPVALGQRFAIGLVGGATWDDLNVALICSEVGSLRRAATLLGLEVSTVQRRVDRLESAIGVQIFRRANKGLSVTEEGRELIAEARTMEAAVARISRLGGMSNNGLRGMVRVAISEGLGTYWVLPRLLEFQKTNRRLIFELQGSMDPGNAGEMKSDIAILFDRPQRPDLITKRIGYLHTYPFVSRRYFEQFGIPKSMAEVAQHRFVIQVTPTIGQEVFERLLGVDSLEGLVGVATTASSSVLYAVERDAGIGILPTYALALGARLVPVDIGVKNRFELWLTYHAELKKSERHMAIVEWLCRIFDPSRFPCFQEEFIDPRLLASMMKDNAAVNHGAGYIAGEPLDIEGNAINL